MKQYFYITTHFSPEYIGYRFAHERDDLYRHMETGEMFRRRLLYDFGWGQEYGFQLLPAATFDELIALVETPFPLHKHRFWGKYTAEEMRQTEIWRSNLYGAIAVIMEDHVQELVDFLAARVGTGYFDCDHIRRNFFFFAFDSQRIRAKGLIPGGIRTHSYEEVLNTCPGWAEIAPVVILEVYGG